MFNVSETIMIQRTPAEIFPVLADPYSQLDWDKGGMQKVEKLSPGPLAKGAKYRGTFKGAGTVEYEFTTYDPDSMFAHYCEMNICVIRHIFEPKPFQGGSKLTQSIVAEPRGFGKLLKPVMKRQMMKRVRTINSGIKKYMETER